jgi:branched-chain amino acid transport system substrate-binding protein
MKSQIAVTRRTSLLLLVAIVGSSFVLMTSACRERKPEEISIGSVLALTGSASVWGENTRNGMELALEEVNAAGGVGGKQLRVIYEDSKSEPRVAVDALRKVISANRVPAVIGDIASSNVLAMAPVAESEKVALISPGASNPDISFSGDYIFRNFPSDALEGTVDGEYASKQLGWRKVAVLNIKNAYGEGVARVFREAFKAAGGEVALDDAFDQGAIDFRGILTKVKGAALDGVFLAGYPDEMAKLLIQAKELGVTTPFLSTQAFDDPQVLKIAGQAADGVTFSTPAPPAATDPVVAAFREKYKRKYGKEPGLMSDTGYDALKIIALAIERGGYTADGIKAQLANLKSFRGAAGLTSFDKNGDVARPVMFKVVKNGQFADLGYRVEPR